MRFLKSFLAGFATGLILVTATDIHSWTDLHQALLAILLSGSIGGLNGLILAFEKWANWQDSPTV